MVFGSINLLQYRSEFCSEPSREIRSVFEEGQLFNGMDSYEISRLGEILKQINFDADEFICKEGEQGNEMYLIEEGKLVAIKNI
jgi:CRP-like cAMP-binding protein